jgi:hypothetical protein
VERSHLPWFRFASAQFGMDDEWDPYRLTEGISADPVAAAELGMANLRTATENLMSWVLRPGDDYYELETHYLQNLTQWNRYAEHAAAAVGGSWTHHKRFGEEGVVYTPVEPEYQRRAMQFIDRHVLADAPLGAGRGPAPQARARRRGGADPRLPGARRAAPAQPRPAGRMIEHEAFLGAATYRPAEMLDDAREIVWREVRAGRPPSTPTGATSSGRTSSRRTTSCTRRSRPSTGRPPRPATCASTNDDPPLNADLHVGQSDIRPLIRDQLRLSRPRSKAPPPGVADRMTRIHLEDALERVELALRAPTEDAAPTR